MEKQLQTIYEYLGEFTEDEIKMAISKLTDEERKICMLRYGNDLQNSYSLEYWEKENSQRVYNPLISKIKKLLSNDDKQDLEVKDSCDDKESLSSSFILDDNDLFIAKFIFSGKTNDQICKELDINQQQLAEHLLRLKNKGVLNIRKYYSDGTIKYKNLSSMQSLSNYNSASSDRTIITDTDEHSVKVLAISDLHFCNELERLDLVDRAYNYCAKNGINIILCGGDLIDGSFTQGNQKITDLYKQVEYFLKNYPYDKNILTFSVAGDHDMSILGKAFLDIIEACNNFRHDIIIGGYNNTEINIKSDKILLYHHIEGESMMKTEASIILHGHSHKFLIKRVSSTLNINIPSLSNINQLMPSALELELKFNGGYISSVEIKHIYFGEHDINLSEHIIGLPKRSGSLYGIKNVESFRENVSKGRTESQQPLTRRLTQTERFNKRYGL